MRRFIAFVCLLGAAAPAAAQTPRYTGPIIDIHMHGGTPPPRPGEPPPASGPAADSAHLRAALRHMDAHGVVLALTGMPEAERLSELWRTAAPDRLIVGPQVSWNAAWPDTAWLRAELAAGRVGVIGELNNVHVGVPPTDPRMEALFRLAHEYDVPIGVHIGRRRPEISYAGCCTEADHANGNPELLRPILERYPGLRLYLMHVGGAHYTDESLALMRDYPNVYADLTVVALIAPRELFHANVRRIISDGLLDRILFGSDGAPYIGAHIEAFEAVAFLSPEQKRALFYGNAARFLRLDSATVRRHHAN